MYFIVAGIIFVLSMVIVLFLDGFSRAIAPKGLYELSDDFPHIIMMGFGASGLISLLWIFTIPLIVFGGFIIFAGYKVGQLIGKYEIKRK